DLEKLRLGASRAKLPGEAMRDRLRLIDEVGWFDSTRIGVLLPYTDRSGAQVVVAAIGRILDVVEGWQESIQIYVYPSDQPHHHRDGLRAGASASSTNGHAKNGHTAAAPDAPPAQPQAVGTEPSRANVSAAELTRERRRNLVRAELQGRRTADYDHVEWLFA